MENLTTQVEEKTSALLAEIEELGGSITVIESGWMQARISESAYRAQQAIERGESVLVGVNRFQDAGAGQSSIPLQRISNTIEQEQITRLQRYRSQRDPRTVREGLAAIRQVAQGNENLLPFFMEALDAGATLGEICDILRSVFGTYHAHETIA